MRLLPLLAILLALVTVSLAAPVASAARLELPTILVDLAHGQNSNGVCAMMSVVPDVYWVVVVPDNQTLMNFPAEHAKCIMNKAYKIVFGNIATALKDPTLSIDMIIIGQPTIPLSDEEKEAIAEWLSSPTSKALWCATDSDYPAQGGAQERAQHICNDLLDYLSSKGFKINLRSDYVSVEDPTSCAKRSYRVIAYVKPPAKFDAELLRIGAEKVLMHGPGAVAWVDDQGNWHKVTEPGTPDNIIPIIVTTPNAVIVEHQAGGATEPGKAHTAGEKGVFVLMAAQVLETKNGRKVIIVSGESPYYGYQSMVTFEYYGYLLDGPRFFRNLILWATGDYAELKEFKVIEEKLAKINTTVSSVVKEQVKSISEKVDREISALKSDVDSVKASLSSLSSKVSSIESKLNSVASDASNAKSAASSATIIGYGAIALAIIALIVAALLAKKK